MDVNEILENGYDEKVKKIIRKLNKGKDRDEVAEEIGYSSKSGLDSFMRRRDFKFDGEESMYIPKEEEDDEGEEVEEIPTEAGSKVSLIIGLFENTEQEPEEIAKSVGFDNFRELADFMERKGYCWNSQRENYESKHKDKDRDVVTEENKEEKTDKHAASPMVELMQYIPLLEKLSQNEDKLDELLSRKGRKPPRYSLRGEDKTVGFYISNLLDKLVKEYADKKNVSKREVVEGALVEYLQRYGYREELRSVLGELE